jgi:hypothetical protein
MRFSLKTAASLCVVAVSLVFAGSALADSTTIDFEAPAYAPGSIDGQDGWSSTGPYDQAVATGFDGQALRISNAITSGAFGDQTFSKSLGDEAGEASAENDGLSGGTRGNYFEASWQFASTVPGALQEGLSVVASPDRGDGARMSWIQMADTPTGLAVNFFDYQDGPAAGCDGAFVPTTVVSDLDRGATHEIGIRMWFVPGAGNDVAQVLVNGAVLHSGTSWEDYFRFCENNPTRTVDSILFRTAGPAAPGTLGNGFLIDNLSLASSNDGGCAFDDDGSTWTLLADCTTDETIEIPNGYTLDGDEHTITAVDPAGGHFVGAVVANGGDSASVTDVKITASELANVCDGGAARLRGILLDGASGSITSTTVHGVRQGLSGCQEGNAIEVRHVVGIEPAPGPRLAVMISGNTVYDYMKNGITTNGNVAAAIQGNTVTGDGNVSYIAQNGIQVGFGASATVEGNTVSGNWYTAPAGQPEFDACGLLFFDAAGVKQRANTLFANEKNLCNFGRGGGKIAPTA